MKKLILVAAAALALPLAACQKAEEATVVEAVPADEAATATEGTNLTVDKDSVTVNGPETK